jgi:hypothetical protein
VVIRPDLCPSRSCLSSKLTPADRNRRPNVCFKSWTLTCVSPDFFRARRHPELDMWSIGFPRKVNTCVGCFPRRSSMTDNATSFNTTSRSSPFLTAVPGIRNTDVLSSGTACSHSQRRLQISLTRHPVRAHLGVESVPIHAEIPGRVLEPHNAGQQNEGSTEIRVFEGAILRGHVGFHRTCLSSSVYRDRFPCIHWGAALARIPSRLTPEDVTQSGAYQMGVLNWNCFINFM